MILAWTAVAFELFPLLYRLSTRPDVYKRQVSIAVLPYIYNQILPFLTIYYHFFIFWKRNFAWKGKFTTISNSTSVNLLLQCFLASAHYNLIWENILTTNMFELGILNIYRITLLILQIFEFWTMEKKWTHFSVLLSSHLDLSANIVLHSQNSSFTDQLLYDLSLIHI